MSPEGHEVISFEENHVHFLCESLLLGNTSHIWLDAKTCNWVIQGAQDTDRVTLQVTFMQISNEFLGNCSTTQGHLEIRDGPDSEAPLPGRFCGNQTHPPITSQGSTMYIPVANQEGRFSESRVQRFMFIWPPDNVWWYGTENWNKTGDYCRRSQAQTLFSTGSIIKAIFKTDRYPRLITNFCCYCYFDILVIFCQLNKKLKTNFC